MKTRCLPLVILISVMISLSFANAQPGARSERRQPTVQWPSERRPLQDWMQELKEKDPEEYSRLKELQTQHPAAFTRELRDRIRDRMLDRFLDESPVLSDVISQLPDELRKTMMEELRRSLSIGSRRGLTPRRGPRVDSSHQRKADTLPQPRRSTDRDTHVDRIREYDLQTEVYEREIKRIKQQLERLHALLQKRRNMRDTVMQQMQTDP